MPEALVAALDELDAAYREAKADPVFQARFTELLRDYAGTPSLLYRAERLSAAIGAEVCSSARTSTTPARTRSATCSARRCWPSGWASRG